VLFSLKNCKNRHSCNYSRSAPGFRRIKNNAAFRMPMPQTTEIITIGVNFFVLFPATHFALAPPLHLAKPPPLHLAKQKSYEQTSQHIKIDMFLRVTYLKGRVHCFSMQVVINKCFLLNLEKKLALIRLVVFEKNTKKANFTSEK